MISLGPNVTVYSSGGLKANAHIRYQITVSRIITNLAILAPMLRILKYKNFSKNH